MKIKDIKAYELLDSRGNPTVGTKIILSDGSSGFAISPSGASTGIHEAHELRDKQETRYNGKGTKVAVNNVNTIIKKSIIDRNFETQKEFDKYLIELDGTENKSKLGANAILSASLGFSKALASHSNMPLFEFLNENKNDLTLPRPMMNILNGGAHASNNIDIQEFMIIPMFNSTFAEKLEVCAEIYHKLGKILNAKGYSTGVGDEGGYAPKLENEEEAIEYILEAIIKSGNNIGEVKIALDIAASEWYNAGKYHKPKQNKTFSAEELIEYYENLVKQYPIVSIEDPLGEDDFENFKILTEKTGDKIQIVGDDLFVTNIDRLNIGIREKIANAILIKPNQIGTLTETIEVIKAAKNNGYNTIISHRSGETEDTTIADIAVALGVGQIKSGAPCRTDRVCKYNRLLMIEDEIGY
ncbi:MAG: phosphopyruvate hydratase [Clostridia bacterium]|nr:phosphopyruvate hydratase [Clostridia bacterium]